VEVNAVGDLVVVEPECLRGLAHPARLAVFDALRRVGPAARDDVAHAAGNAGDVAAHLAELERLGFVERDGELWRARGRGVVFEIPDDPEGQAAGRALSTVMMLAYDDRPRRWVAEHEPQLSVEWARAAGLFNARLELTADELAQVQVDLERVLAPYLTRDEAPAGAQHVRLLAYFLPEPPPAA
jgi:hypothetical protein